MGLWRVGAVATRRGAGRPAAARKTSMFSVKKKHKSINTKNIAKLCSYEFTSTTAILRTTHAIGKPTTTCAYLPLSVSSVTRVAIRAMGHTHKSYGVLLWWFLEVGELSIMEIHLCVHCGELCQCGLVWPSQRFIGLVSMMDMVVDALGNSGTISIHRCHCGVCRVG